MYHKIILSTVVILLFFLGCGDKKNDNVGDLTDNNQTKKIVKIDKKETKKKKSAITVTTANNDLIKIQKVQDGLSFSGLNDKVVLLNFSTTWCSPCRAQIPHLVNLQKKYKNKLEIINVILDDTDSEAINEFIKTNKINFKTIFEDNKFELTQLVGGVNSIPYMILYDSNGKYVHHYLGAILEEILDIDIVKVVSQ